MTVTFYPAENLYTGLANDSKPTSGVKDGSRFLEQDTGKFFSYQAAAARWLNTTKAQPLALTADEKAALDAANAPDADNPFATIADTGLPADLDTVLGLSSGQDVADALTGAATPSASNVFATMGDVGSPSIPDGVPHWIGPLNFQFSDAPNDGDIFDLFDLEAGDFLYDIAFQLVASWDAGTRFPVGVDIDGPNEVLFAASASSNNIFNGIDVGVLAVNSGYSNSYLLATDLQASVSAPLIVKQATSLQIRYDANGQSDPALQGEVNLWLLLARGVALT